MDSYVIHIYRRELERLVGTVEDVERGHTKSFSNAGELWRILLKDRPEGGEEAPDEKDR